MVKTKKIGNLIIEISEKKEDKYLYNVFIKQNNKENLFILDKKQIETFNNLLNSIK